MKRVLISDNLGGAGIQMFEAEEGIAVDVNTGLSREELKAIIGDYHALVIRSATHVNEELLNAAKNLKVVGRAGIGLDNVDIPAATQNGVVVMNTPEGNAVTTAEHSIAMILALSRNIPWGTSSLKAGRWDKKKLQGREIFNKTLGVIGYGKIGSIVADRARGLKMKVIVYDPYITDDTIAEEGFEPVSLNDLYHRSDYITVHVPKLKKTTALINKEAFDQMKPGVMIVNCARGGIVNEDDLNEALKEGRVAGAALDVFETEPPGECKLFEHDRVICTPHLGASTLEAQTNVAVDVAGQIIGYLKKGTIINAVNVPSISGEHLTKLGPYLDLGEKIGILQSQINQGPTKEVTLEYAGDFGELDLTPVSTAVLKGILAPMVKDEVNFVNARLIAKERGIKVKETTGAEAAHYMNLINVEMTTSEDKTRVSGTIFGKNDPRIVKINNFELELAPEGHLALISNRDKPGAIGSIDTILGRHNINISQMQAGREKKGAHNFIFLRTDTPISDHVIKELTDLPLVKTVKALTF